MSQQQQQQQHQRRRRRRFLITGATGNVGREVVRSLLELQQQQKQDEDVVDIVAGVRNVDAARSKFPESVLPSLSFRIFDFEDSTTFPNAFEDIDGLFLLRPPHISDVERVFRPLLKAAKDHGRRISIIVFLSVQGAEKSSKIPHNRIEKLIQEMNFPSTVMVRPSYFMQNLTTTFLTDLQSGTLVLPSGNAVFNWIDVQDIGKVVSVLLLLQRRRRDGKDDEDNVDTHCHHQVMELTGSENKSFPQAIEILNRVCGTSVEYRSINSIRFFFHVKRTKRLSFEFALVVTLLHSLPRWQKNPPDISCSFQDLMGEGQSPTTLEAFFQRERGLVLGNNNKNNNNSH